jgi:hypothetical protein
VFVLLLATMFAAVAQDIPEEEEGLDIPDAMGGNSGGDGFDLGEKGFKVADKEEDVGMLNYAQEAKERPAAPTHFHLKPLGKTPLKSDYPMQVVAMGASWLKIELPVLVAQTRADFQREYPNGLRVKTEWDIGGTPFVIEQTFTAERVWDRQPTLAFFDVALQDARKSAPVQIKVFAAALPAPPPPPEPGKEQEVVVMAPYKQLYNVTSVFFRPEE